MTTRALTIAAASLAAALLLAAAPVPAARDWASTLREDARALHAIIVANHPGPVNRLDPGFSRRNDAALRLALARAERVRGYPGYAWAMRGYTASFDDGHVQVGIDKPGAMPLRWPGFLTGFDGRGRQVVMTRADDAALPLGAELEACDGIGADRLAERQVAPFRGRWTLAAQRALYGGRLFLDAGNPFIALPVRCRFRVEKGVRAVTLAWRPLSVSESDARLAATAPRAHPTIEGRTLPDGTRWFSMSSFDGDPEGPVAKALRSMIAGMARDRAAIARAPAIVLDLRGNNGGASDWSDQVARILWGAAAVDAVPPDAAAVEWRASPANLRTIEDYQREFASADASPAARAWADRTATGLSAALRAGRPLWRAPEVPETRVQQGAAAMSPPRGPVFVLTDWGCGSACLDAVDLWRALGAIQVGQETSADTLYMDLRRDALPGGVATLATPMKVYRGRKRGANVPAIPVHCYTGDLTDTDTVARWISTLPRPLG